MKKLKLSITNPDPLLILGLISTEKDLKMAWVLNNLLKINLVRYESEELDVKIKSKDYAIFQSEEGTHKYTLLSNKVNSLRLFEDLKKIDYLLVLMGDYNEQLINQVKLCLQEEDLITAIFEIPFSNIKNKEVFFYL